MRDSDKDFLGSILKWRKVGQDSEYKDSELMPTPSWFCNIASAKTFHLSEFQFPHLWHDSSKSAWNKMISKLGGKHKYYHHFPFLHVEKQNIRILYSFRVSDNINSVQFSRSVVSASEIPWIAARQASLFSSCPQSLPASVFSNESTLHMRWPKYWSFSFSISPSNEHPGLISFRMDWLDPLEVQGTLKSLLQHHSSKASILWHSAFFTVISHNHTWPQEKP